MRCAVSASVSACRRCAIARHVELAPGLVGAHVLGWIEPGKMPADDVASAVAVDAFRAAVPAGDHALFVEGHDGIVDHALDQQAEAFLALAQSRLVAQPLRQVARDLGIPEQVAALVTDGRDHHVRPEGRAILADPPAFFLEAAVQRRDVELASGALPLAAVSHQETREVRAHDLGRFVTQDLLGTGIPACDVAIRVEHEDGIVAHALDQRAETHFVVTQRLFVAAPLGEVARHLGITHERAIR
jgi:hypothetical protein